jgi:hypothetical protein
MVREVVSCFDFDRFEGTRGGALTGEFTFARELPGTPAPRRCVYLVLNETITFARELPVPS